MLYRLALTLENSVVNLMTNSEFSNSGEEVGQSSILQIDNSNITITNSIFSQNIGKNGGSIGFVWDRNPFWENSLSNITFLDNQARTSGGAIFYDIYRPSMENITFSNNTAPYGNDIASYPVKLIIDGTNSTVLELNEVVSGQQYPENIKFNLVDFDNQITSIDISGSVTIKPVANDTFVLGRSTEGLVSGSATFDNLQFIAQPGSERVQYQVDSDAIDKDIILKQFGTTSIQENMRVTFRYCMPGEIIENNQCQVCNVGTYSFQWNSTECTSCMGNANCLGGLEVYVDDGYWRKSTNSTSMIECLRDKSCKGGYHPENQHPVRCDEGYKGILWTEWVIENDKKYERLANYEWSKWPSLLLNSIRIFGLVLLVAVFFIIIIVVNIRKRKESQQSILLRILANYFQLLTATLSFNLKFPDAITEAFYPLERIGNSSEAFLSFDCFIDDTEIKAFTPSNAIFKIMLTGLLPLGLILFAVIVWVLISLWSK